MTKIYTLVLAAALTLPNAAMAQRLQGAGQPAAPMLLNVEGARTLDGAPLIRINTSASLQRKAAPAAATAGYIFANKTYSSTWSDYARSGIYVLGTDGTTCEPYLVGDAINGGRGMCIFDGQLWVTHVYQAALLAPKYVYHYVFDLATGQLVREIDPGYLNATARSMVQDRYTGTVYGSFASDDNMGDVFGTLDPTTGIRTALGNLPFALTGLAIDSQHRMWGINHRTGILYQVNMATGALTQRGKTGLKSEYINSGCIDPLTDTYYYTVCNKNQAALYTIDLATAEPTLVKEFPLNDEYVYMWMPTARSQGVPAMPQNLEAHFEGDALQGTLTYTVAATLASGQSASGTATATVYVNGEAVAQHEVAYGTTVTESVAVPQNGPTVLAVALTNDQGESPVARTAVINVGGENLPAPTGVYTRTFTDTGAVRIYWDAYPGNEVTYDVTRYPDATLVATGLTTPYYREVPPSDLGSSTIYYGIRAHVDGRLTDEAFTDPIGTGATTVLTPPYDNCFENRGRVDELTYINANNDDYVWLYATSLDYRGTHGIYMPYNARELTFWEQMQGIEPETDDWAVTPGLRLEKGKVYTVTYNMSTKGSDEIYEVKMGTSPTVAGMTTTLIPRSIVPASVLPVDRTDYSTTFTAPADGTYYIGLHCMSAGGFWLCVYEIHVSEGIDPSAPAAPAIAVEPDADGALQATVTVTAPDKTLQGATIASLDHIDVVLDEQVVHTWNKPTPGEQLSAVVSVPRLGTYDFEARAYNSATTSSRPGTATAFIGAKAPSDVAWAAIAESSPGEVTLTWPAVTTATDGSPIDPAQVTYLVYDTEGALLHEVAGDTTVTFRVVEPNADQTMVRYYIGARYGNRYTYTTAFTPYATIGRPYDLPFYETSNGATLRYFWMTAGDALWKLQTDAADITSADGDGSFFWMRGEYVDDQGQLTSGKIRLTGRDLKLEMEIMTLRTDSNTLAVNVLCDGASRSLATLNMWEQGTDQWTWHTVEMPLDQYAGKTVQVQLVGTLRTHGGVFVDAIKVTSTPTGLVGDLNGDGAVDVEDVNLLINVILELQSADTLSGNADITGDGSTDIEDVNALINLILI